MFKQSHKDPSNKLVMLSQQLVRLAVLCWVLVLFWLLAIFLFALFAVTQGLFENGLVGDGGSADGLRNIGLALGAFLGIPVLVWRLFLTSEGQITERFSKAVDQLSTRLEDGEPNIEARVGALHALERISKDSITDHLAVTATICAYIRVNTLAASQGSEKLTSVEMRLDIETALKVLFDRRSKNLLKVELQKNFACSLRGLKFNGGGFVGARLWWVDFLGADLRGSNFYCADFTNAYLVNADLRDTDLSRCKFDGCSLSGAKLSSAQLSKSENFQHAYGVKEGENKTLLPDDIPYPSHWYSYNEEVQERGENARDYRQAYIEFIEASKKQLSKYRVQ